MGIIILILGLAFVGLGLYMIIKTEKSETVVVQNVTPAETKVERIIEMETVVPESKSPIIEDPVSNNDEKSNDDRTENEKKGLEFEKWVISKFPKKYYKLIDWKGDKMVDGRYAESSRYPDLELELSLTGGKVKEKFSVECKWRKAFYEGKINWASQEKIDIYNDYAKTRSQSVFLILGVGGEPKAPERVYVIPLEQAQQSILREDDIEQFRRKEPNKDLYYFAKKNSLS